jgi:hypothetical protein
MKDILINVLTAHFTWGLLIGLVFAAWAFCSGWSARRTLRREVRRLEEHCRTQLELDAKGRQALLDENASLKQQAENLRISLADLKNKPDKAELLKLHLYDRAVHLMYERAPGFASAWESTLKDAQAELDKTATGFLPFIRRLVRPSLGTGSAAAPAPTAEDPAATGTGEA